MREESFGVYSGFPEKWHRRFSIKIYAPPADVQRALVNALYELNGRSIKSYWTRNVGVDIDVIFEFGVADNLTFHYIDSDTLNTLLKAIREGKIRILDIICIVRYYVKEDRALKGRGRKPLRFDYYLLRFIFNDGKLEVRVFHVKGPQRILIDEVAEFLANCINARLNKKNLDILESDK
ncbi:MAG: hypothetical protein QXS10_07405 [Candidatus Bathyarchaeia archaeon]|nr:hypothetical protein [Candidatus Bathyarchaeota archaeon]